MASPRLRALGIVPGAAGLKLLLGEFSADGSGLVTSLGDGPLRVCSALAGEFENLETAALNEVVRRAVVLCGESPAATASGAQLTATVAVACETLEPESPFAPAARFVGLHRALSRTLKELASWGIGSEQLRVAAERTQGRASSKFASLAVIRASADETLQALGRELMDSQIERVASGRIAEGCSLGRVLVLAGSCHEPVKAAWLRWLAEQGSEVWVAVEQPSTETGLFAGASSLIEQLGVPLEPLGEPNGLARSLFTQATVAAGPAVAILSAADAYAEAEWALRGCRVDLARGLAPQDLAIYVRNPEEYGPYLTAAAERLGVKLRLGLRSPLLTNRFARHLLDLLEFCAGDDARALTPHLRSTYFDLSREARYLLAGALKDAYKARKNQWPVLRGWAEGNADLVPWLGRLLDWRHEASKDDRSLSEWVQRLGTLGDLLLPGVGQGLPTTSRDARIMAALRRPLISLASVRKVSGDRPMSLSAFVDCCREAWGNEEYTVPPAEGGIEVVSSTEGLGTIRSLRALGMLEGVFPRRRSEDPVLSDADRRELLSALDLPVPLPDSFSRACEERDEFYRLCSAPSAELVFSYPQTDDTRDNVRAFYLHEIERACPGVEKIDHPRVPFVPAEDGCIAEADRDLRHAIDDAREEALAVQFLSREVADSVAWPEDRPFTPRDLRDISRCEFRHFIGRRLGLKPPRSSSRWSALRRLPQSARLMQQPNAPAAQKALEVALEAELDELYGDLPEWEMALLKSGGRRLIAEWVKRETTARQIWPRSEVHPDRPFGSPGLRDTMPGGVGLAGTVAGVSQVGPYAVAHLYETVPPKADGKFGGMLDEADTLYYGLHLLSRYTDGATALEVESMAGTRTMLVLPRMAEFPLSSRRQVGLEVVDLAGGHEPAVARKAFYDEVKRRLKRAVARLRASGIEPMPGEHCAWCGFGELCRRAHGYGEEDSPFGIDEIDDAGV